MTGATAYSPQEVRLRQAPQPARSRVQRLLQTVQNARPVIDIERGKYFTEGFRRSEGQPLALRWAKSLYLYAEQAPVYIGEGQLLAGRAGAAPRCGLLYPELDGDILGEALRCIAIRENSPFAIAERDRRYAAEEIAPYWKNKTFHEALAKAIPAETLPLTYNNDGERSSRFIVNETASFRSSIQWVHDYETPLRVGFLGVKREAEQALAELDEYNPVDSAEKKPFLQAVILAAQAIMLWAKRHAALAGKLAAAEEEPGRKAELLRLAEVCARVPAHPARNFYEAVQCQWFVQLFSRIEQKTGTIISNGRMDQYLFPYYQNDLAGGTVTPEQAQELLECLWLSMAQYVDLYLSGAGGAFNEGYAHWEAVTVGGQTPEGDDATNDLTYLILKSKRDFPLNYPDLAVRVHTRSPERYLRAIAETVKDGAGFPKLINDEEVVPLLLAKGAGFNEAFDYAVSGCAECRMPNRDTFTSPCAYVNFAAALELTLYNGAMRFYGGEQLAPQTGRLEDFTSFADFFAAYLKQQKNLLKHAFLQQYHVNRLRAQHFAAPLGSSLHRLCMEAKKDLHSEHIPGGIDLGYFECIGYATVIDSLAAIKKWVFDEKLLTPVQLKEALESNFAGHEDVRLLLRRAPAYGNDDPCPDEIGKAIDREAIRFTQQYSQALGVRLDLRYVPFTANVPFGKVISATPNGRFAWSPLSDGSSASQGADLSGPTAVLLSNYATKNYDRSHRAARLLNIKLSPACVAGESGTQNLIAFIRAWRDLKLWHVQFNVINRETLLAARANPEAYRNLLVRVAGYSAYFCELSPELQEDIIARTEHGGL
ncbi:MAG: glycyl radical protein [Oscillospiraceae bacterium]|jgi:formate C-acetyltransferase|nr:glycyl radical protein [Oscillospiraceae bacterium]